MAKNKKPKGKRAATRDLEQGILEKLLQSFPKEQLLSARWKVYHDVPGKNGGFLQAYAGTLDYSEDTDMEELVHARFKGELGGGNYYLKLFDSENRRLDGVPPIRIILPGAPKSGGKNGTNGDSLLEEQENEHKFLTGRRKTLFLQQEIKKMEQGRDPDDRDPMKDIMLELLKDKLNGNGNGKSSRMDDLKEIMLIKSLTKDDSAKSGSSDTIDKSIGAVMTAVSGMVSAQASMNTGMMTQYQTMMQSMNSMGQQDPWIVALDKGPELLKELGGFFTGITQEVRDSYLDVQGSC